MQSIKILLYDAQSARILNAAYHVWGDANEHMYIWKIELAFSRFI